MSRILNVSEQVTAGSAVEVESKSATVGGKVTAGSRGFLARLFGGQGTIDVPSWSPDSKRLAFVSYQLAP